MTDRVSQADLLPLPAQSCVPRKAKARAHRRSRFSLLVEVLLLVAVVPMLGACGSFSENYQRGYVLPEGALEQIPIGATQEQVLIVLGTPSTVATVSGEVFYYISQKTERSAAFMPREVKDQRVIAVYFNKDRKVTRLANFGLKDGKVFDFISRTTPTGGEELNYLSYVFKVFGGN